MRGVTSRCAAVLLVLASVAPLQAQSATLAHLVPAGAQPLDHTGTSVAISGDRLIVGSASDAAPLPGSGSVTLYERASDGTWQQAAQLVAADGSASDFFGGAVALDGDRALIGAWQADGPVAFSGAAYVFERQLDGTWLQTAKLVAPFLKALDAFGYAVALQGGHALIGAPAADFGVLDAGGAFVYAHTTGGAWHLVADLHSTEAAAGELLGVSVALDGDRALLGAPGAASRGLNTGAACVFELGPGGVWAQTQRLVSQDAQSQSLFGDSVALQGGLAVVGEPFAHVAAPLAGAACVFELVDGTFTQTAVLQAPQPSSFWNIGAALTLDGDLVVLGGSVPGSLLPEDGVALEFQRQLDHSWTFLQELHQDGGPGNDEFAKAVALEGDLLVASAPGDDSAGAEAGAAWLLDLRPLDSTVVQLPLATGGTQPMALDAGFAHAGETYLVLGTLSGAVPGTPLPGGLLLPLNLDAYTFWTLANPNTPPLSASLGVLDATGHSAPAFTLPPGLDPLLAGLVLHHAAVVIQAPGGKKVFASNALPLTLVP